MANLMVHRNVLKNFNKLPAKVQKKISEWIDIFQIDPFDPAIGLHSLKESMLDPKVRGADLPGGYRAIVIAPEVGETFLLVHIDMHDKAYDWARNKRFEVHEATGVFQVFDLEEVQSATDDEPNAEEGNPYPLNQLSDDELFHVGVPKPLIPAVRAIRTDNGLESLSRYLPADCRDILYGIAAGMTVDEALQEMLGMTADALPESLEGGGDFRMIDRAPNFDLVLIDGEEHLRDILAASLEEWRIFLHPYQKKLVEWVTKGPMSITGSAGTGKTVALMHRAVHLARKLRKSKQSGQVLLTTFTTNLSIALKGQIQRLGPDVAESIEVTNLHALARTICLRSGWKGQIAQQSDIDEIWDDVFLDPNIGELPFVQDEMKNEYLQVVDANGITDEDTYLTTVRTGRPRVSRKQRKAAWPVFRAFQRGLKKRNLLTFEGAIHQARLAIEQGNFEKYAHVLVDEAQDFSLEALRLIKALSPIEEEGGDPLCLAGDGHQRIYRAKFPMSRAGIEVRGRSRRLKINYRTSEQIRKYAQAVLQGIEVDNLDGETVQIVGDHSVFKGPEPQLVPCATPEEEAKSIVAWVEGLLKDGRYATYEICVTPYKPLIRSALGDAGIDTHQLKPREDDPGMDVPGVRMGTIKRIKGLEFKAVALACADPKDPMNAITQADILDRCERYVAATRAREQLLVTLKK
nr:UvrD-helicase domain-containing protein [uncultured Desulfobulbus sp.]